MTEARRDGREARAPRSVDPRHHRGALACVAALIWLAVAGGGFTDRFGVSLIVIGALASLTNNLTLTRFNTADTYAWFGHGPELDGAGGGQVLTGVGIFLFVSIPLIAIGALLAS